MESHLFKVFLTETNSYSDFSSTSFEEVKEAGYETSSPFEIHLFDETLKVVSESIYTSGSADPW